MRQFTPADKFIDHIDTALRTMFGKPLLTERTNPADREAEVELSRLQRELAGRLMRINHAGEVAAQGLYEGQSLTAKLPAVRQKMQRAAMEENDHLDWCEQRTKELGTHVSYLNPLWYGGSVAIGALAGLVGDRWSLGFVIETEKQVVAHLQNHIAQIDSSDRKTHAILQQMSLDEAQHATMAKRAGGAELPTVVKKVMAITSKAMTRTAYWV